MPANPGTDQPGAASATAVRTVALPSGEPIPVLGQGTWGFGEGTHPPSEEVAALRLGLDLGMTLIDTAEMYADGGAERVVGEAVAGRRDDVFLVSKVLPHNATQRGTAVACERSLRRLGTDRLDLYLLHWRGPVNLADTVAGFQSLVEAGKIRYWGVSNFDVPDMAELAGLPGGTAVATDQVLYSLNRRGVEYDLLPWCQARGLPIMAYSPFERGAMLSRGPLRALALRLGVTPAQLALAWVLRQDGVSAIPRARKAQHLRENRAALDLHLSADDLAALDRAFPPPRGPVPLEML